MKFFALILVAGLLALPATAATQLERGVAMELPRLGFDVDVQTLSRSQVVALHSALNSGSKSHSDKIAMVRSILGGTYSLRGLVRNR